MRKTPQPVLRLGQAVPVPALCRSVAITLVPAIASRFSFSPGLPLRHLQRANRSSPPSLTFSIGCLKTDAFSPCLPVFPVTPSPTRARLWRRWVHPWLLHRMESGQHPAPTLWTCISASPGWKRPRGMFPTAQLRGNPWHRETQRESVIAFKDIYIHTHIYICH